MAMLDNQRPESLPRGGANGREGRWCSLNLEVMPAPRLAHWTSSLLPEFEHRAYLNRA